jgi:hypothetical protein
MAGHDIVDAEWDEVPDHGGNLHVARPTDRPAEQARHSTNPANQTPPRRDTAYGLADVRRFFRGLWRAFLVLLGILVLLFLFFAFVPAPEIDASSDDKGSPAATSSAGPDDGGNKQMLSDWSQAVMGKPSAIGFALIDGVGKPGEFCSSSSGTSLMNFGGRSLPREHADMYTYFSWLPDKSDVGIVGFFSFDADARELLGHDLIKGNVSTDVHDNIADIRLKVQTDGSGNVTINGTRYHLCVL